MVGAEHVGVGEAVPEFVIGIAESPDIEESGAVAGAAVKKEHCDFAAGKRYAAAGAG